MDGSKKSRNQYKVSADHRSDRKSASGMNGDAKKGGRGGKFTWEGADGYADEDLDLLSGSSKNNRGNKGGAGAGDDATSKKKAQDDDE